MNKKNIYVIRHGQTDWNLKEIIQGTKDIPLNDNGRKQANELKDVLKNIRFDKIISSPLKRAFETAQIVNKDNIQIDTDIRLIERGYGKLEGISQYDLKKFNCTPEKLWSYDLNYSDYQVEPINLLLTRVTELLDELIEKDNFYNLLISTHNITSIAIKYYFEGKKNKSHFEINDGMRNCEYKKYNI